MTVNSSVSENRDRIEGPTSNSTTFDESSTLQNCLRFFSIFFKATGTLPILIITLLVAFGIGSVAGVVPEVVADRYARTRYDYSGPEDCSQFDRSQKPEACQQGADDAQAAAAASTLALNMLTLIFNPVVGSISDVRGRRGVLLISLLLYSLGSIVFVLLQVLPWLSPNIYYVAVSLAGAVEFTSMSFAAASDVLPEELRAAGYGLLLAGYYSGFSFAPSLPLIMSHFQVSIFSCTMALLAFFIAIVALPETLPETVAEANLAALQEQERQERSWIEVRWGSSDSSYSDEEDSASTFLHNYDEPPTAHERHWIVTLSKTATRPIRDMSILTRGNLPILAAASFFSAMVYSSDKTFVIYYIEDQLNVRDADIAKMFLIFCPLGVIIQAFLIQPLLRIVGEKQLLIIAFLSGTCHNALYGLARSKSTIIAALCLSQLTKVNFPILSSYASRSASAQEQGRVQGALFALNALANAAGPMLLELVYDSTKQGHSLLGPGSMFLFASGLYATGTFLVTFLPPTELEPTSEIARSQETICNNTDSEATASLSLQEPLLDDTDFDE